MTEIVRLVRLYNQFHLIIQYFDNRVYNCGLYNSFTILFQRTIELLEKYPSTCCKRLQGKWSILIHKRLFFGILVLWQMWTAKLAYNWVVFFELNKLQGRARVTSNSTGEFKTKIEIVRDEKVECLLSILNLFLEEENILGTYLTNLSNYILNLIAA